MSEYIITEKQLKTATEAYVEREIPLPFTEVYVSGDKLPEIVRCRDCVNFDPHYTDGAYFDETVCWAWDNGHDYPNYVFPDGFCCRGERRDA